MTPPAPRKRDRPRCATMGIPHINKSQSTCLLSLSDLAGPRKKRTRTRESDLFDGADAFDSLTGQQSIIAMADTGKESGDDSRFTAYIHDTPVKKMPTIEKCAEMVFAQMKKVNEEYMAMIDKGKTSKELLRSVSYQIMEKRGYDMEEIRESYIPQILCYSERVDYYETQTERLKSIIDVYAKFYGFLKNYKGPGYVDIFRFVRENRKKRLHPEIFEKHDQILLSRIPKTVKLPPPSTTDPLAALRHPSTKTGQIIQRFIKSVDSMYFPDVEVVAEALAEQSKKFDKDAMIRILFDIAWESRTYPLAPLVSTFKIPNVNDLCPKAFNAPFLSDDFAVMTFNELSASDWPLKTAVDMLFDIVVLTNPFDIADAFYRIIEEIGRCAQRCLIRRDQDARNVEIDFDQLFVLMLICIFTSGLSEICAPMQYSSSFREYVMMDTTKVYAMSHMEGLCVHLVTMDYGDVRKRSAKILAARDTDPLGLL